MTSISSVVSLALLLALSSATAAPQYASGDRLQAQWEQLDAGKGGRLGIRNLDRNPLPAQGWSIYFNCIECAVAGSLPGKLAIDELGGTLYRLRPEPGFGGLAPGQALDAAYRASSADAKMYRAPSGLYLVYGSTPEQAQAITDYQLLPLPRPDQLEKGQAVTALDLYQRNARTIVLPAAAVPPIFPTPLQLQKGAGTLHLESAPAIVAGIGLKNEAGVAESLLKQYWPASAAAPSSATLRLTVGAIAGQASPEAYTLAVDANGVTINGNSAAGVAHGLQSLRDLLPLPAAGSKQAVELPVLTVTDAPRFAYRGLMLDVSRNFQPKQTVFRLLDLMARFKLNVFHFHLTDDEGWRLEIPGLPELTGIGAVRGHSAKPGVRLQPEYGSGPSASDPHGSGYYSRADYLEILRYAAARHIEVIPEIEMPGHARAAVQAMEARYRRMKAAGQAGAGKYLLNDLDDRSQYKSAQNYNDNVMNPGLESSFSFIEHVVKQVAALHREAGVPLRSLHVGGDEVPAGAWEKSPASRTLMARKNLQSMAELWDYFYDRVDAILRKNGLATNGWEELGTHKHTPNPHFAQRGITLHVWNNIGEAADLGYRLANAGYDVVLAPATRQYLDMSHNKNPDEPGVNWAAYIELDDVYNFIPLDASLTEAGKARIRGLEAALWTETIRDPALIDYLLVPRLLAVAERAWAADPAWATEPKPSSAYPLYRAAWSGFVNALGQRVLPRLDLEQAPLGPVNYRIAPPGLAQDGGKVYANHALPGLALRYTSDGSEPTTASPLVQGPIAERGLVQVAAFDRNGRRGTVSRIDNR
ncbi:family 20 glycosylhydrolase [Duganella sp. Root1480D1]|uniref:family 20 glycosylhydrolase n=1 Tax=Duganella sp. Root1480D1 TaxID=1736471 RepID=UPI00070BD7D4|nr:family 20 glycosylhydrolase [Duganella sp. Root1480D1]KQZ34148.1 beta-hexosaminidase [Duganella sp. Root1480D1]